MFTDLCIITSSPNLGSSSFCSFFLSRSLLLIWVFFLLLHTSNCCDKELSCFTKMMNKIMMPSLTREQEPRLFRVTPVFMKIESFFTHSLFLFVDICFTVEFSFGNRISFSFVLIIQRKGWLMNFSSLSGAGSNRSYKTLFICEASIRVSSSLFFLLTGE